MSPAAAGRTDDGLHPTTRMAAVAPHPGEGEGLGGETPAGSRRLDPQRLNDHVDRLFRAAWALCGQPQDAEDLVQETYARVLARPRWLRGDDDLGYLLRVLRNTHVSRLRAAGRRADEVPFDDAIDSLPAVERAGAWQPEQALEVAELFAAIAALPLAAAEVVVAVDVVGLSYREAAAALRIREVTVTQRLFRARRRLALELGAGART